MYSSLFSSLNHRESEMTEKFAVSCKYPYCIFYLQTLRSENYRKVASKVACQTYSVFAHRKICATPELFACSGAFRVRQGSIIKLDTTS